jgi:hypothetical protein
MVNSRLYGTLVLVYVWHVWFYTTYNISNLDRSATYCLSQCNWSNYNISDAIDWCNICSPGILSIMHHHMIYSAEGIVKGHAMHSQRTQSSSRFHHGECWLCSIPVFFLSTVVPVHAANGGWSLQIWSNLREPPHEALAKFCQKEKHCSVPCDFSVQDRSSNASWCVFVETVTFR